MGNECLKCGSGISVNEEICDLCNPNYISEGRLQMLLLTHTKLQESVELLKKALDFIGCNCYFDGETYEFRECAHCAYTTEYKHLNCYGGHREFFFEVKEFLDNSNNLLGESK